MVSTVDQSIAPDGDFLKILEHSGQRSPGAVKMMERLGAADWPERLLIDLLDPDAPMAVRDRRKEQPSAIRGQPWLVVPAVALRQLIHSDEGIDSVAKPRRVNARICLIRLHEKRDPPAVRTDSRLKNQWGCALRIIALVFVVRSSTRITGSEPPCQVT